MGNYSQILTKGLQSALANLDIDNGKLRLTTDTFELYFDNENSRIKISDVIKDYTEEEIKAILAPLPKIYLSSDTHKLFIFDDNGECVEVRLSSSNCLPENCNTVFNDDGTTKVKTITISDDGKQINEVVK